MKNIHLSLIALSTLSLYGLSACDKHDHAHDDHGHDHDHSAETAEKEAHDDHDHEHEEKIIGGPSGGRVLNKVEPHLEFFVTDDRKVQIAQMSEDLKIVPIGTQVVSLIAGDRANPTKLTFTKTGDVLLSNEALPAGNDFPLVIDIKSSPEDTGKKREKFNLNLAECPTCSNKEYACTCDHEH
jgi:hypothetical protein